MTVSTVISVRQGSLAEIVLEIIEVILLEVAVELLDEATPEVLLLLLARTRVPQRNVLVSLEAVAIQAEVVLDLQPAHNDEVAHELLNLEEAALAAALLLLVVAVQADLPLAVAEEVQAAEVINLC